MQEFKPIKEGKVREVYDNGESLIIVATDRISAFDHILKNKITDAIKKPVEIAYVTLNTIAFTVGKRPNASPQTAVKTINAPTISHRVLLLISLSCCANSSL